MSAKEQRRAASGSKKRKIASGVASIEASRSTTTNGAGEESNGTVGEDEDGEYDDTAARATPNGAVGVAGPSIPRVAELQAMGSPLSASLPSSSASSSMGAMGILPGQDFHVHRCRFVDYMPGSVTALALTPSSWDATNQFSSVASGAATSGHFKEGTGREVMAVGRGNGDIEIWAWAGTQHWLQIRRMPGHIVTSSDGASAAPKIEHLVFAHQTQLSPDSWDLADDDDEIRREEVKLRETRPRLLGSTGGQEVVEWEWEGGDAGKIKRTLLLSSTTTIWSMALSPRSSMLAVGCDDGVVRIVSILDDTLELSRSLDPCRTRLLSVAWGPPDPQQTQAELRTKGKAKDQPVRENGQSEEHSLDEPTWLVAGCADSTVRKFDMRSGRSLARMTVDKMKGEHTLVWAVAVVANTIISGDSLGNLKFFDPIHFTQLQTIRAHRADILCLSTSPDGSTIFSAGVDQQTCQVTRLITGAGGWSAVSARWTVTGKKRLHSHDIRALAVSPPFVYPDPRADLPSPPLQVVPVLISGGLDCGLVLCPAASPTTVLPESTAVAAKPLPLSQKSRWRYLKPKPGTKTTNPVRDQSKADTTNPITEHSSPYFHDTLHRRIQHVPQRDAVVQISRPKTPTAGAHGNTLMFARKDAQVTVWQVGRVESNDHMMNEVDGESKHEDEDEDTGWQKVLDMDLNCQTNLIASAISTEGRWLAVSDLYETKLFRLGLSVDGAPSPRRVKSFAPFATADHGAQQGASHMVFSPGGSRLVLASVTSAQIVVVALPQDARGECEILRVFDQHHSGLPSLANGAPASAKGRALAGRKDLSSGLPHGHDKPAAPKTPNGVTGPDSESSDAEDVENEAILDDAAPASIAGLAISSDGLWAASVDTARRLHVFNLDALRHHCALPSPDYVATSLVFMPSSPQHLVVGLPDNSLHVFDVEERSLADWARHLSSNPPQMLQTLRDPLIGLAFDPAHLPPSASPRGSLYGGSAAGSPVSWDRDESREESVIMWGATWICRISFSKPLADVGSSPARAKAPGKRRRGNVTPLAHSRSSSSSISTPGARPLPTFRLSHKYKPILFLDFLSPSEMVIVERPFFNVMESLPPAWERTGQYGT